MSRLIIAFESVAIHRSQPWPVGVDDNDIVTSGLGKDDGAKLVGFGELGDNRITVFPDAVRRDPELAVGLVPTFSDGSFFEWALRIKEVTVRQSTTDELRAKPFGSVVYATDTDRYFRKGPKDTWHPILPQTGERFGQGNAIRSAYLEQTVGPITDATAECERLSKVNRKKAS
jgi:hypothetical protein